MEVNLKSVGWFKQSQLQQST